MSESNYITKFEFKFRTREEKQTFLKIIEDKDKGIAITKAQPGCISVVISQDVEDEHEIYFSETWKDKESYDNHIEFRNTLNQKYPELLLSHCHNNRPRNVRKLKSFDMESDESKIKKVINSLCTHKPLNAMAHCNFDYMSINDTGQPMSMFEWDKITKNGTVVEKCNELVKFNRIKTFDNMAFVCYTTHCIYSLNGTKKDEKRVKTTILERCSKNTGKWFALFTQNSSALSSSVESPNFPYSEHLN